MITSRCSLSLIHNKFFFRHDIPSIAKLCFSKPNIDRQFRRDFVTSSFHTYSNPNNKQLSAKLGQKVKELSIKQNIAENDLHTKVKKMNSMLLKGQSVKLRIQAAKGSQLKFHLNEPKDEKVKLKQLGQSIASYLCDKSKKEDSNTQENKQDEDFYCAARVAYQREVGTWNYEMMLVPTKRTIELKAEKLSSK